ncbi:septum site-determining protein MinC [uncultured Helicobacter sp.]|uniref:septum site-determining protein MinC n=1 Tax=uncultured Helicobacter sp. TaxID=175537 RepID=UPI002597AF3C|nr:septum site-determining protein MinC [uncultured Helicobacter sp.]
MKMRQKQQKMFIFEDGTEQEYETFIQSNTALLESGLIYFQTEISQELEQKLRNLSLSFLVQNVGFMQPTIDSTLDSAKSTIESNAPKDEIFYKVRSGEEIESKGNVIVVGDIASGANIKSNHNIIIFGDCYGVIESGGEFVILKQLKSGHISFGGEVLPKEVLAKININSCLKIIVKKGDNILIKEII